METKRYDIRQIPWHFVVILAASVAFGLLVLFKRGHVNGFPAITQWEWPWRNLGNQNTIYALVGPFVAVGGVVLRIGWKGARLRSGILLATLAICSLAFQILGTSVEREGLGRIEHLVVSNNATGYLTDALTIQDLPGWLRRFHELDLTGHASTHPAGPILFYYVIAKFCPPHWVPFVGGCLIGLMGSLGVVVMYYFAALWTTDRRTRLLASAFYTLIPALVVFFPEFDQAYPVLSMLMVLCWVRALRSPVWWRYAIGLGAVLAVAVFFAYNLLTMGAFLAYFAVFHLRRERWSPAAWAVTLRAGTVALGAATVPYVLLWFTTGYNATAAFVHAWNNQILFDSRLNRPYTVFAAFDLYDFALGGGMIALPIVMLQLFEVRRRWREDAEATGLTLICLATIVTIDLSGVLRGEAARVWLFLQPLVVAPFAMELIRWRWPWRLAVFTVQWWILVCLKAKMTFVWP